MSEPTQDAGSKTFILTPAPGPPPRRGDRRSRGVPPDRTNYDHLVNPQPATARVALATAREWPRGDEDAQLLETALAGHGIDGDLAELGRPGGRVGSTTT